MPHEPNWWYGPPSATATLLAPIARVYGGLARARLDYSQPLRPNIPVICVGNFTAGGSGKTPFTITLVDRLMAQGHRPAILSRGYGGRVRGPHWVNAASDSAIEVGDEPLLLARHAPTLVARDRAAGALAITASNRGITVMDDGLQNPGLVKDLSFAVIDGARGLGNGRVIPSGPLRAPWDFQRGLVHAIVLNGDASRELTTLLACDFKGPVLQTQLAPVGDISWLVGARVLPFAGIGNPARFFATLESLGADLVEPTPFPDHAVLTPTDARNLMTRARARNALLVTTQKDHARMSGNPALSTLAATTRTLAVAMTLDEESGVKLDALTTPLAALASERLTRGA
jgi:tetraacyldisaccharide 4'-kinase